MSDAKGNNPSMPNLDTTIQEHTYSRYPTTQVKITCWAVRETGALLGDEIHLFLGKPDAMYKNDVGSKKLELVVYAGVRVSIGVL